mmetsp:Transcript_6142/g.16032  ORF Transcript_6142/g.16032 Transcript_6142/m.16032 type:complete len:258 (-) Transcript_6142:58-831(-)
MYHISAASESESDVLAPMAGRPAATRRDLPPIIFRSRTGVLHESTSAGRREGSRALATAHILALAGQPKPLRGLWLFVVPFCVRAVHIERQCGRPRCTSAQVGCALPKARSFPTGKLRATVGGAQRAGNLGEPLLGFGSDLIHIECLKLGEGPRHVEERDDWLALLRAVLAPECDLEAAFARLIRVDHDRRLGRERFLERGRPRFECVSALAVFDEHAHRTAGGWRDLRHDLWAGLRDLRAGLLRHALARCLGRRRV